MSLVPLLFRDWWDDFDGFERERPSRLLDQHFGLGLKKDDLLNNWSSLSSPLIRPGRYFRPWKELIPRQTSGSSLIKNEGKAFEIILDVQQFTPSEITVKVVDGSITVEGKHEEKQDEHGYISRHFVRRYVPPSSQDLDINNVVSSLSSDGVLTISVPKKSLTYTGEKVVPIVQTGVPAVKPPTNETQIKIEHESK
uniref:Lethal(2)essential for life protein-like protein n=1 Tax=Maconellicoccus hirsutus TaxID=177089 RepID=A2I490_MACHI|nr:lethal(2)essential for life protein-like protein [Maconellicoccus hirsutus]